MVSTTLIVTVWLILACVALKLLAMVGLAKITVGSFTLLFAAFAGGSPPPLTLAVLIKVLLVLIAALADTLATTLITGAVAPAANTPLREQLTVCPDTEQVHPAPLADSGVMPAGKVSVTVIAVPFVAPKPLFCAVSW